MELRLGHMFNDTNITSAPPMNVQENTKETRATLKITRDSVLQCKTRTKSLLFFPANAAGQLHVSWHDGHTPGVNRAQVGVFEEGSEVRL